MRSARDIPVVRRRTTAALLASIVSLLGATNQLLAGGTLTPVGSPDAPIQILDHHVNVVINNGFARTEVVQTFFNPNDIDLEAVYAFPVPKSGSLSEMTIYIGEQEIHGEVLSKDKAKKIYEEEKADGNDVGLAEKNSYQTFEFRISPVRAGAETRLRFVYYQPLLIDTGIGRYIYPLEDGGTDDIGASFWIPNERIEGTLSADIEIKSAFPISDVRVPGFEAATVTTKLDEGHYMLHVETREASLNRDLVVYYRLQDGLPGRVEMLAYRADEDKPGTFMLVVTPGLDLQPLGDGADYIFVLDVSGSMSGKIGTLARGVSKALGEFSATDRFRVITFESSARELTRGWIPATPERINATIIQLQGLQARGSTNLYEGLELALRGLDDDRATSIVLVTDAVTNTGVIDPAVFYALMKQYDVRIFGFLLGNSANWPLMELVTETSGGFYAQVSNADDILGQILLAKSKITYECLHDAELKIKGVQTFDSTDGTLGKVYRGEQLVFFGRYDQGGEATVTLEARLTGEDKVYSTSFTFPEIDTDHPELERLWAVSRIEAVEAEYMRGSFDANEADAAVEDLGVAYQLVTDQTSMVVLSDEAFAKHGIDRRNQARVSTEREAQAKRRNAPPKNRRVDRDRPMFDWPSPSPGGGGALDPVLALLMLSVGGWAVIVHLQESKNRKGLPR